MCALHLPHTLRFLWSTDDRRPSTVSIPLRHFVPPPLTEGRCFFHFPFSILFLPFPPFLLFLLFLPWHSIRLSGGKQKVLYVFLELFIEETLLVVLVEKECITHVAERVVVVVQLILQHKSRAVGVVDACGR